jgi:hypothetical protein
VAVRESYATTKVTPTITFITDKSILGATVFGAPGSLDNVIFLQYGSLGPKGMKTATGLDQEKDAIDFPLVIRGPRMVEMTQGDVVFDQTREHVTIAWQNPYFNIPTDDSYGSDMSVLGVRCCVLAA